MDFRFYFQILPGQWLGVILDIPYWGFRVFSSFLPNKNSKGVFSSDLKMDAINLCPITGSRVTAFFGE